MGYSKVYYIMLYSILYYMFNMRLCCHLCFSVFVRACVYVRACLLSLCLSPALLSSLSSCSTREGHVPLSTSPRSASPVTPTPSQTPPICTQISATSPQATPTSPQAISSLCYSLPTPSVAPPRSGFTLQSCSTSPPQVPLPALDPHPGWLASEDETAKKLLYCSLCKVTVNSLSQLDAHNTGY